MDHQTPSDAFFTSDGKGGWHVSVPASRIRAETPFAMVEDFTAQFDLAFKTLPVWQHKTKKRVQVTLGQFVQTTPDGSHLYRIKKMG